jgi:hypothetical protein
MTSTRIASLFLVALASSRVASAIAQAPTPDELRRRIDQLEHGVEQLESRLRQLESRAPSDAPKPRSDPELPKWRDVANWRQLR